MTSYFLRLTLIIFICFSDVSQASLLKFNQLTKLSDLDGLENKKITNVVQDERGYIWASTIEGIFRFDENRVMKQINSLSFENSEITYFKIAHGNQLLISSKTKGTYLVNTTSFKTIPVFKDKSITSAIIFKDVIYAAEKNNLYKINIKENKHSLLTELNDLTIQAIKKVGTIIYIGTNNGLYSFNINTNLLKKVSYVSNPNANQSNIKQLCIDPFFGLIVGTKEGIYVLSITPNNESRSNRFFTIQPDIFVHKNIRANDGFYISSQNALYFFDRESQRTKRLLNFDTVTSNPPLLIKDIMLDNMGVLWITTKNSEVYLWSTDLVNIEHTNYTQSNTSPIIFTDKNLYLQSTINKVNFYDDNNKITDVFFLLKKHNNDKEFKATNYPSYLFKTNKQTTKTASPIVREQLDFFRNTPISVLNKLNNSELGFVSDGDYFTYNINTKELKKIKGLVNQLATNTLYRFLNSPNSDLNILYLSTTDGLYQYNRKTQILTLIYKSKNNNLVNDFTILDNTIWLATSLNGIVLINRNTYDEVGSLNAGKGFLSNNILSIQKGSFKDIWYLTPTRLKQFNDGSKRLLSYELGSTLRPDQLINSDKLDNNELIFSYKKGNIRFLPSKLIEKYTAKIALTQISLPSKILEIHNFKNNTIELSENDFPMQIHFSDFDYLNQEEELYSARLSGEINKEFLNLHNKRVTFDHLPKGSYQLIIKKQSVSKARLMSKIQINIDVNDKAKINLAIPGSIVLLLFLIVGYIYYLRLKRVYLASGRQLEELKQFKVHTELALSSINSGVWEVDLDMNFITRLNDHNLLKTTLGVFEYFENIHPQDRKNARTDWLQYIRGQNTELNVTYRLKDKDGNWIWYNDVGCRDKPSVNNKKLTGVYNIVDELKSNELGIVNSEQIISQISDFVIVLNPQLIPTCINNRFYEFFEQLGTNLSGDTILEKLQCLVECEQLLELQNKVSSLSINESLNQELTIKLIGREAIPVRFVANSVSLDNKEVANYTIVVSDLTEQKKSQYELRKLANYDALTYLPNRNLMLQHLEFAIFNATKSDSICALLFIDLDKFKPINDAYGHIFGDQLLVKISEKIQKCLPDNCILGRQSSDEFLIIIEQIPSVNKISEHANLLLETISESILIEDNTVNITASIGIAVYPFDGNNATNLIRHADIAMINTKESGRNSFKFFTTEMNTRFSKKLALETTLKVAHTDKCFFNNYQPIINSATGQISGAEVLLRWNSNGEPISPSDFIPIAEDTGLIVSMTESSLKRAISELKPLIKANSQFYISLNLSPLHILRTDISHTLINILNEASLTPSMLRLEITESLLMVDKVKAKYSLTKLKQAGFTLLLDDFGTGYSSLTYLSQFPIDIIKIDQDFVSQMDKQAHYRSIVKTICSLAENLQMSCISEGVETKEQLRYLTELGCIHMQGYYFSKPLTAESLIEKEATLKTWKPNKSE